MSFRRPSLRSFRRLGLLLVHLALPVGLWFTVRIGRPRFVGLALYLVCAVLLVDVLLALSRPSVETVTDGVLDARVPTILLILSGGVLALLGPGVLFYLGATGTLLLVLLRVFAQDESATVGRANVGLVCGTSALLLSSQVFTVAYYVNTPDTINHTSTAIVLAEGGSLSAIEATRYFSYSALHVLASTGLQFTQLKPRLLMGLLTIGLFQVALLAAFLFFANWGKSRSLALIGTLLVSINIAFLHYGSVAHYQSLSFVFFCVFLALLSRGQWTARDVVLTIPVVTTWIVTHHVSVLMAITLLVVPLGYLVLRIWKRDRRSSDRQTVFMFSVFCLTFGIYWSLVTAKFQELLVWTFFSSSAAEGLPSDIYLVQTFDSLEQLLSESVPFFLDSLHYSFLLALACIGILVILTTDLVKDEQWHLVLLGFLPAAVLYFPNPVWIPLEGLIPFNRWRLMLLPFLMLVPAVGFRYGMQLTDGSLLRRVGVVLFTAALVFTTVTSGMAHPGLTDLAGIQKGSQDHLTDEELRSGEFVHAHMDEQQQVYARSKLRVYLRQYAWVQDRPYTEEQFANIRASQADRRLLIEPGLTVVSVHAFRNNGIYAQMTDLDAPWYLESQGEIGESVHAGDYHWDRTDASVVYSNGDVVIHHR